MLIQEFVDRTGYYPASDEEWRDILRAYHNCDEYDSDLARKLKMPSRVISKDEFCQRWLNGELPSKKNTSPTATERFDEK